MPTSNGQITSRDIRQKAVKSLHIVDANVTTAKIADLAVTFPDKIDDPIYVAAFETAPNLGTTLNTSTFTEVLTDTVDVPAWVDAVSVLAIGMGTVSNTTGSDFQVDVAVLVDGSFNGLLRVEVPLGGRSLVSHIENANLTGVAGSSVTVSMEMRLVTGTNSTQVSSVWGMVVGQR